MDLLTAKQLLQASIDAYSRPNIVVGDDAALVQEVAGLGTVIAFRGTIPPDQTDPVLIGESIENWLADGDVVLKSVPYSKGAVHTGFANSLDALLPKVIAQLWQKTLPVWVTGHSLGGALATLCARELKWSGFSLNGVYTCGSPRVGDTAFAKDYNAAVTNHFRFEDQYDVVPWLPPCEAVLAFIEVAEDIGTLATLSGKISRPLGDYQPVGTLEFLNFSGGISSPDSWLLGGERDQRMILGGSRLITDHLTSSYQAALNKQTA